MHIEYMFVYICKNAWEYSTKGKIIVISKSWFNDFQIFLYTF